MARFVLNGPPSGERAVFVLARVLAALLGTIFVLLALLYSSYIAYTDIDAPETSGADPDPAVDIAGRRVHVGRSFLARDGRLWLLHLEGSPEAIGDAHGRLTARLFRELDTHVRGLLDHRYASAVEAWAANMLMRWDYRAADLHVAPGMRRELGALALAMPEVASERYDSYHLLFLHQCLPELSRRLEDVIVEGSVFAATPPRHARASGEGNLLVGRTLSIDLGREFEAERVVQFVFPDGKYPFVSIGWPGLMGVVTGINARGVFVALNPARTDDPLEDGAPLPLLLRQVLEEADTLENGVEILRNAHLRTSGIVLIADGVQRKAVVMEIAARDREERRIVRGGDDSVLYATDHMISDIFERDAQNDWVRRYTSSGYRFERLRELLRPDEALDVDAAVRVLRDRHGRDNEELGLGNRNAIENLATTHSVVVDATAMVLWISEGPSTLGRYRAFDLRHHLGRQGDRPAPLDEVPPDPLLYSEEYRDYQEALEAMEHARFLLGLDEPERALWSAQIALALAPDVGELHRLLGDIERELGRTDAARRHYTRYLELIPGRLRDQERVRGILAELEP